MFLTTPTRHARIPGHQDATIFHVDTLEDLKQLCVMRSEPFRDQPNEPQKLAVRFDWDVPELQHKSRHNKIESRQQRPLQA